MESKNIRIDYLPRDTKFHFRLAFPVGIQNKLDSDLRLYKTPNEYRPVLLKEALVNGIFLAILLGLFAWLNSNTLKWEYYIPVSVLLIVLFMMMIYKRRVNKSYKRPLQVYNQVQKLFENTDIENNTLTEQSTYCFKFRKNNVDCEISYNIYRKVFHLFIYPPSANNFEEKADIFVEKAKGNWFYDEDEEGNFLACTINKDSLAEFPEILEINTLLAKEIFY